MHSIKYEDMNIKCDKVCYIKAYWRSSNYSCTL